MGTLHCLFLIFRLTVYVPATAGKQLCLKNSADVFPHIKQLSSSLSCTVSLQPAGGAVYWEMTFILLDVCSNHCVTSDFTAEI